jgi:hypothetical protein
MQALPQAEEELIKHTRLSGHGSDGSGPTNEMCLLR